MLTMSFERGERSGGAAEQRSQDRRPCDGGYPDRQGAGAVPGPPVSHPLQYRSRGQRLFHRKPDSSGVFRRGISFGHRRLLHPGVQ